MKAMPVAAIARAVVVALAAVLAACGSAPKQQAAPEAAPARAPQGFPVDVYERLAAQGEAVYRVGPADALVVLTVRRGGSLGRLGHDHVIASRSMQGFVAPAQGRADLYMPLAELTVDEPALRTEAGLDTQPTASDIEGTRTNMQDKVLRVQEFPYALVQVRGVDAKTQPASANVSITLLGTTRTSTMPLILVTTQDALRAIGMTELKQSEFGIAPFSLLGGALQVEDAFKVRFDIRARASMSP
ncbi:YceI-like domain-containing protein [Variovorax sp. HW608]|uniref:YceI family protein n=1 Tax=Variovorax sp. HW608 TaxID=1034889 RepID=UPI00081FFD25|nr:YceI family protein [Variovorax sp. HW608]SCK29456.1 YceI-like domain-containing protein [Variovorax sp. HW608]